MKETSAGRREFIKAAAGAAAAGCLAPLARGEESMGVLKRRLTRPLAITMWDFSWLERRWPGAGYESWDVALDELKARGYDAVRIDAYPHLVAADARREWELLPCWNQQDWGSPAKNRVRVQPSLNEFIAKCRDRGLLVGLTTWFRQDRDDTRMKIRGPEDFGGIWKKTVDGVAQAGLLDSILYVDLCNEYPLDVWAPFLPKGTLRASPLGTRWMRDGVAIVREAFPRLDYTVSFTTEYDTWREQDVSFLDFLELHLWMAQHASDFYEKVGYYYERFESKGYENVVDRAEPLYRQDPAHWQDALRRSIHGLAEWSRVSKKALATTECWALVDYKDWPLLEWGWIKELCEVGVRTSAETGRWFAIATSNFCGPQFRGMWRDVAWHRRMTDVIHGARIEV
jgi:hypothetical protein